MPRSSHVELERVSARFRGELFHPYRKGILGGLQFSPDGTRLIAGDSREGVIALWDTSTGTRLTTLKTGEGSRFPAKFFHVTPDWKTVYVARKNLTTERTYADRKVSMKWTFDGDVRGWNLEDGKLVRTYKHQPPRGIWMMTLSPDGSKMLTTEHLSGGYEKTLTAEHLSGSFVKDFRDTTTLWDVKTGQRRPVAGVSTSGTFSRDGRLLVCTLDHKAEDGYGRYAHAIRLIDTTTGQEKWTVPIAQKNAWLSFGPFSRDGRLIFGLMRQFEGPGKGNTWLKWWDAATGREVASFDPEKNDTFYHQVLSPDEQTLAVTNWKSTQRKLFLFSVPHRRLLWTTALGQEPKDQKLIASGCAFSPDGKRVVVVTRVYPEKDGGQEIDPRDLPQPRIHVIETATGSIRETIVVPQTFAQEACFSPDGRRLATAGMGRVLFWDMTKMP